MKQPAAVAPQQHSSTTRTTHTIIHNRALRRESQFNPRNAVPEQSQVKALSNGTESTATPFAQDWPLGPLAGSSTSFSFGVVMAGAVVVAMAVLQFAPSKSVPEQSQAKALSNGSASTATPFAHPWPFGPLAGSSTSFNFGVVVVAKVYGVGGQEVGGGG